MSAAAAAAAALSDGKGLLPEESPTFWKEIQRNQDESGGFARQVQNLIDSEMFVTRNSLRARVPKRNKTFSLFGKDSNSSHSSSSSSSSSSASTPAVSSGFASLGLAFKKKPQQHGSLTSAFQPQGSTRDLAAGSSSNASAPPTPSASGSSSSSNSGASSDWTPEQLAMSYRTYRAFIEQNARALPARALTPSPPPSAPPPPPPSTPKPSIRTSGGGPSGVPPPPPPPPKPRSATISEMKVPATMGANGAPVQFDELVDVLEKANNLVTKLEEGFQSWCDSQQSIVDTVDGVNVTIAQFEENKKQFVVKMKKYLNKPPNKEHAKMLERDRKVRNRRQVMEMQRFDIDSQLQTLRLQREILVLKPLAHMVNSYAEFFKSGMALMGPLQTKIDQMNALVRSREEAAEREMTALKENRKLWEKRQNILATGGSLATGSTPTSSASSTGIRDLDSGRPKATTDREKEGYLYLPSPHFTLTWVSLRGSQFIVQRPGQSDLVLPVQICTVKEVRDKDIKMRLLFQVISPTETVMLHAENQTELNEWICVIQNAISHQLNASHGPPASPSGHAPANVSFPPSSSSNGLSSVTAAAAKTTATAAATTTASTATAAVAARAPSPPSAASSMSDEKRYEETFALLQAVPGNMICADCEQKDPDWLSLNLGILMCMECSGVHRSLGVHISKVRSLQLDKIDQQSINYLRAIGNANANAVWEAARAEKRVARPDATAARPVRELFIRNKYDKKEYLGKRETVKQKLNEGLFDAIQSDRPADMIKWLAWGADAGWHNTEQEGRTPLHQSVMYGNPICVECVAQHSLNVNNAEARGWTALHYASYQDDPGLVELLLLRGGTAMSMMKDNDGLTPLEVAQRHNPEKQQVAVHTLLTAAEAKVRAKAR